MLVKEQKHTHIHKFTPGQIHCMLKCLVFFLRWLICFIPVQIQSGDSGGKSCVVHISGRLICLILIDSIVNSINCLIHCTVRNWRWIKDKEETLFLKYLYKIPVNSWKQAMNVRMTFIQLNCLCNYLNPIMLHHETSCSLEPQFAG